MKWLFNRMKKLYASFSFIVIDLTLNEMCTIYCIGCVVAKGKHF